MKNILFVCVHNAGRSQMAEALLNHLAKQTGLPLKGESAGTQGAGSLNPVALQVMEEIGVDMGRQHPKILTQEMVDRSDKVISMGCGVDASACPAKFLLTEDWGLDDPAGQDVEKVREIRDQIVTRVQKLIDESR